jgi:hypothetical protein
MANNASGGKGRTRRQGGAGGTQGQGGAGNAAAGTEAMTSGTGTATATAPTATKQRKPSRIVNAIAAKCELFSHPAAVQMLEMLTEGPVQSGTFEQALGIDNAAAIKYLQSFQRRKWYTSDRIEGSRSRTYTITPEGLMAWEELQRFGNGGQGA